MSTPIARPEYIARFSLRCRIVLWQVCDASEQQEQSTIAGCGTGGSSDDLDASAKSITEAIDTRSLRDVDALVRRLDRVADLPCGCETDAGVVRVSPGAGRNAAIRPFAAS